MSKNSPPVVCAAEKAAKALREKTRWYASCGRYVPESELCEAIQAAIDEATKEQQERIDALVEALK